MYFARGGEAIGGNLAEAWEKVVQVMPNSHRVSCQFSNSMPGILHKLQSIKMKAGASYMLSKNYACLLRSRLIRNHKDIGILGY